MTVRTLIEEWLARYRTTVIRRDGSGPTETSIQAHEDRLLGLLAPAMDWPVAWVTPQAAQGLMNTYQISRKAVTCMNARASACLVWGGGPWKEVTVKAAPPVYGKEQLSESELARLVRHALKVIDRKEAGWRSTAGVLCLLLFGRRSGEVVALKVRDLSDDGARITFMSRKANRGKRFSLNVPEYLRPALLACATGKKPDESLIGVQRGQLRKQLLTLCGTLGLPEVTAHSLRGSHATLSIRSNTPEVVANALGNTVRVAQAHYIATGAEESALAGAVASILQPKSNPVHDEKKMGKVLPFVLPALLLTACAPEMPEITYTPAKAPLMAEPATQMAWGILGAPGEMPEIHWATGRIIYEGKPVAGIYAGGRAWVQSDWELCTGPCPPSNTPLVHELLHAALEYSTGDLDPNHVDPVWQIQTDIKGALAEAGF